MFIPKKKEDLLTPKGILERVSPLDIYGRFLGETIYLDTFILNTIRGERTPSLRISCVDGVYLHLDFGNSKYRGNCFQLVQQKYNCDFNEALIIIDKEFGLGLKNGNPCVKKYDIISPSSEVVKTKDKIKWKFLKSFDKSGRAFWDQYHLEEDYLKSKNTYQITELWINDTIISFDGPGFAYYVPEIDRTKIYLPYNNKEGSRKGRFYSDMPFTYMYKDNIFCEDVKDMPTIVCKSRKDELIFSLYHPKVTSVQAESLFCFNEENIEFLRSISTQSYIQFGSDKQGKEESIKITRTYGFKHLNTPDKYLIENINDIAELQKYYGPEKVKDFLKYKNII